MALLSFQMPVIQFLILLSLPSLILGLSTPVPVFTLPGGGPSSWFENLAVRPNGKILATRGDAPEIWQIDPATGSGSLLVTVEGAFNLTGIAEVATPRRRGCGGRGARRCPERYVFGSSYIPEPFVVAPGSAKVWTLEIEHASGAATATLLAAMPSAGFINGIAAWGPRRDRVLLADSDQSSIYLMDVEDGTYTTPLTGLAGVNGLQTEPGYVYWASFSLSTVTRIPVDRDAVPRGPPEVVADEQPVDDFALDVRRSGAGKAYVGALYENEVVEVTFGPAPSSGPGVKRLVADNLTGTGAGLCTVVVFGRRPADAGILYASVSMGGDSASIVAIDPSE